MLYKNNDYTIWTKNIDNYEKYYIQFHGQVDAPEMEIDFDTYTLYTSEFSKPLERQRKEKRRHLDSENIEYYVSSGKLQNPVDIEEQCFIKEGLNAILQTCTATQRERFTLYFSYGLTYVEIARRQKVDVSSVRESVSAVTKKIKKFF